MKHLLTLALLLCLGTFASAQIPSYVPTNGLVGWWPFNGNANDESGNGNHGTVNGATLAADRFGNPGKAYSFDGVDDFIQANNSQTGQSPFSINVWVKIVNDHSGQFVHLGFDKVGCPCNGIGLGFGNGQTNIPGSNLIGLNSQIAWINTNVKVDTTGNWQFFTLNKTSPNNIDYFINGIKIFSTNLGVNSATNTLFFGAASNQYAFLFGFLDDIAIYNRALSPAEVQQLYLVNCRPTFTAQPQNKSVAQGQSTTFAVQVDTNSTFQWQMNLGLGAGWMNIPQSSLFSGDTTSMLSVQGRNPLDGAQFRCIATACQSDTSNAATLTVTSNSSTLGSVAGVPGKINYQGAAVDSLGNPMKNQTIALQLSVLDSSSTGAAAYVETHSTPTNGSGLFSLQIGGGTAVSGTFDSIPWANGRNKYLKTEVQQNGTWVNLGTSQLVSVPYALHAGSAENASYASQAGTLRDSLGNTYQIKTVNGQPTLVSAPGNASTPAPFACGQAVTYAGESYPTVQIGTQCWFQKNVNAGTMILGANDQTNNSILEKYCYDNLTSNCNTFGGLYQWAEAVQYQNGASNTTSPSPSFAGNVKGICPTGWHVPSDGELSFLETTLGGSSVAGGTLKSTIGLWRFPNTGATNSSGFSALPVGYRLFDGRFINFGNATYFFSSSESSSIYVINRNLYNSNSSIDFGSNEKDYGFSIRCLKD